MDKVDRVQAVSTLAVIRKQEREGWKLIGDDITGWRFIRPAPAPRPFYGNTEAVKELVEEGLLEEYVTGCYRTTEKARRLLDD